MSFPTGKFFHLLEEMFLIMDLYDCVIEDQLTVDYIGEKCTECEGLSVCHDRLRHDGLLAAADHEISDHLLMNTY